MLRETAAEIIEAAEREAAEIVAEARAEAATIVVDASTQADNSKAEATDYMTNARSQAEQIVVASRTEAADQLQRAQEEIAKPCATRLRSGCRSCAPTPSGCGASAASSSKTIFVRSRPVSTKQSPTFARGPETRHRPEILGILGAMGTLTLSIERMVVSREAVRRATEATARRSRARLRTSLSGLDARVRPRSCRQLCAPRPGSGGTARSESFAPTLRSRSASRRSASKQRASSRARGRAPSKSLLPRAARPTKPEPVQRARRRDRRHGAGRGERDRRSVEGRGEGGRREGAEGGLRAPSAHPGRGVRAAEEAEARLRELSADTERIRRDRSESFSTRSMSLQLVLKR